MPTPLTAFSLVMNLPLAWPVLKQIPLKRHVVLLRKQLQHWLRDHKEDAVLYATLAYCAEQDGEPMQAEMAWQKALQYQPELLAIGSTAKV